MELSDKIKESRINRRNRQTNMQKLKKIIHIATPLSWLLLGGFFLFWTVWAPGHYHMDGPLTNMITRLANRTCWLLFTLNVICILGSAALLIHDVVQWKRLAHRGLLQHLLLDAWPLLALFLLSSFDWRLACDYLLIPFRMLPGSMIL